MSFEKLMAVGRANLAAQDAGQEFQLLLPGDTLSGCFLTVHGRDSAAFREAGRRMREKREAENRGLIEMDPDASARDDAFFASWLVSGWRQSEGQTPAFARESVEQLLNQHPYYREQVWGWVNNRAGFTHA